MLFKRKQNTRSVEDWGLITDNTGELAVGGCSAVELAQKYGTPLHVVDEDRLVSNASNFKQGVSSTYPGQFSIHFAFKCNPVPGIIRIIKGQGFKAEVMSEFELMLALRLGYKGNEIIVNGPFKPDSLLKLSLENKVRFIVIDSLSEFHRLESLCRALESKVDVLLRINPDIIPKGMNQGSATGSRKGCAFGLDLKSGQPITALKKISNSDCIRFNGFHFHIGTGIHKPHDYLRAIESLRKLVSDTTKNGFKVKVIDIGGGFASSTSREMTTKEMLLYQGWERLPTRNHSNGMATISDFFGQVRVGMESLFGLEKLPELIIEPGRCITSSSQLLLLTVHHIKERPGVKKWLITDGGIGTVTMPTYYEFHELFLCNDIHRPCAEKVTITGPGCFASDIVYRNKFMPIIKPGEVLAVMDSGAYFTSWESNFSHPRPSILVVKDGKARLIRRRESIEEMLGRDLLPSEKIIAQSHQTFKHKN